MKRHRDPPRDSTNPTPDPRIEAAARVIADYVGSCPTCGLPNPGPEHVAHQPMLCREEDVRNVERTLVSDRRIEAAADAAYGTFYPNTDPKFTGKERAWRGEPAKNPMLRPLRAALAVLSSD